MSKNVCRFRYRMTQKKIHLRHTGKNLVGWPVVTPKASLKVWGGGGSPWIGQAAIFFFRQKTQLVDEFAFFACTSWGLIFLPKLVDNSNIFLRKKLSVHVLKSLFSTTARASSDNGFQCHHKVWEKASQRGREYLPSASCAQRYTCVDLPVDSDCKDRSRRLWQFHWLRSRSLFGEEVFNWSVTQLSRIFIPKRSVNRGSGIGSHWFHEWSWFADEALWIVNRLGNQTGGRMRSLRKHEMILANIRWPCLFLSSPSSANGVAKHENQKCGHKG